MSEYHHSEELREWIESETAAKAAFVRFCVACACRGFGFYVASPAGRDPLKTRLELRAAEADALDVWTQAKSYAREKEGMYLDACRPGQ